MTADATAETGGTGGRRAPIEAIHVRIDVGEEGTTLNPMPVLSDGRIREANTAIQEAQEAVLGMTAGFLDCHGSL